MVLSRLSFYIRQYFPLSLWILIHIQWIHDHSSHFPPLPGFRPESKRNIYNSVKERLPPSCTMGIAVSTVTQSKLEKLKHISLRFLLCLSFIQPSFNLKLNLWDSDHRKICINSWQRPSAWPKWPRYSLYLNRLSASLLFTAMRKTWWFAICKFLLQHKLKKACGTVMEIQ